MIFNVNFQLISELILNWAYGTSQEIDSSKSFMLGANIFIIGFVQLATGKSSPYKVKDAMVPPEETIIDGLEK